MSGILGTLGAVGGAILASGAVPAVVGGLFDSRNTDKTNQANKDIANATNEMNYDVAMQNLDFQRENLDYQKALQQQIFEREDTAYQRTVEDMRAAGLSPLSMQNTNGAGEAIQTEALNNGYQAQGYTAQKSNVGSIVASALSTGLSQLSNQLYQRDALRAEIEYKDAQTALVNAQANKLNSETPLSLEQLEEALSKSKTENKYLVQKIEQELATARAQYESILKGNAGADLDNRSKERREKYDITFGTVEGMTNRERELTILANTLGINPRELVDSGDYLFSYENVKKMAESGKRVSKNLVTNGKRNPIKQLFNFLSNVEIGSSLQAANQALMTR